jgi:hypothetical protein
MLSFRKYQKDISECYELYTNGISRILEIIFLDEFNNFSIENNESSELFDQF